jgi:hypothetical protein
MKTSHMKTGVKLISEKLRFHFLTTASMKMAVFWDVAPCSLEQDFLT